MQTDTFHYEANPEEIIFKLKTIIKILGEQNGYEWKVPLNLAE